MNRELMLLRHGKSDWGAGTDDFHRPLKDRGTRGAHAGRRLRHGTLGLLTHLPAMSANTRTRRQRQLVGLLFGQTTRRTSDQASGTVTAQSPAAGTRVGPGTRVDVVFAMKATPITTYVPIIAGGGAAALIAAGFTWWRRRSHHDAHEAHHPDMRLFPVVDGGEQEIEIDPAGPAAPAVGLRPRRDPGIQTLVVEDPNDDDDASA